MSTITTYTWPGQTRFGFGAASLAGKVARGFQAKHVFIVADPGVIGAGLLEPVQQSLEKAGISAHLYDQVSPNPSVDSANAAGQAFRQSEAQAIIAVGGGSSLDLAKAVRLLAGGLAEASIAEYALLVKKEERRPYPHPHDLPPMIAIPTTAGTGSEVTSFAVITDHERKFKMGIGGAFLIPNAALVDPELTLTLPPALTAGTGLDALTHCIEAYVSTNHTLALDPLLLQAIQMIGHSLPMAVAEGSNRQARHDMLYAAMIGGMAINTNWLGACHSLAHQLSSFADVPHGLANSLMLPTQMRYSLPGALERYAHIGPALQGADNSARSLSAQAVAAVAAVEALIATLDLPTRLRDVGVTKDLIEPMAKNAYLDLNWVSNPREVDEAAMAAMFREVF